MSVSAILYNTTETDKNANIFIAQYDETGRIVDIASSEVIVRHSEAEPQIFELSDEINANATSYKAFIWDTTEGGLRPLFDIVDFDKIKLSEFAGVQSFHTESMSAFLNDSNENIGIYADGGTAQDTPLPITFKWTWTGNDSLFFFDLSLKIICNIITVANRGKLDWIGEIALKPLLHQILFAFHMRCSYQV